MNYEVLKGCLQRLERNNCPAPNKCAFLNQVHELVFRYEYAFIQIHEASLIRRYATDVSSRKNAGRQCLNLVGVDPKWSPLYRHLSVKGYYLRGRFVLNGTHSGVTRW